MTVTIHDTIGDDQCPIRLLYINPNSSLSFTKETVDYLSSRLPTAVRLDFYTAPKGGPPSIDGPCDSVLSAALVLKDLQLDSLEASSAAHQLSVTYSAVIVSCFSTHPLIGALQERLGASPVIGILESAVHFALLLGATFGIATTGMREDSPSKGLD